MTDECCKNCAFHNPEARYECDMTDDLPVVCSVKMRRKREEIRKVKNI